MEFLNEIELDDDIKKTLWATADKLRADLTAAGWSMLDRKDGYSLEPLKKA